MKTPMKFLLATILAILTSTSGTRAQLKYPAETKNAALRYWTAFAEMQDPLADIATQGLIEKMVASGTAWSETTLGSILDTNAEAIRTMQKATKLPECDWGLDYSRGSSAQFTLFLRARALAGLNTLEGMRRMAKGDSQGAVNTWLAGIHFSQDVARGGPLIFTLVAMRMMLPNLRALNESTSKGQLSEAEKKEVYAAVSAQPEDGLDWRGSNMQRESSLLKNCTPQQSRARATKRWECLCRKRAFLRPCRRFKDTENTCSQCRRRY